MSAAEEARSLRLVRSAFARSRSSCWPPPAGGIEDEGSDELGDVRPQAREAGGTAGGARATSMNGRMRCLTSVGSAEAAGASPGRCPRPRPGRRGPSGASSPARKDRAGLRAPVADGDHVVERLAEELGRPTCSPRTTSRSRPRPRTWTANGFMPFGLGAGREDLEVGTAERPRTASAIWLRALLPVHTKRTRIGVSGMVVVLSGGAAGGRDRRLEVDELAVEAIEVVPLTGDRLALTAISGARSRSTWPRSRHRRAIRPASSGPSPSRRRDTTRRAGRGRSSAYSR